MAKDSIRLFEFGNVGSANWYIRDADTDICLSCPLEECEYVAPCDFGKSGRPICCPVNYAQLRGVPIVQAAQLAARLNPDRPESLRWYHRSIDVYANRNDFVVKVLSSA